MARRVPGRASAGTESAPAGSADADDVRWLGRQVTSELRAALLHVNEKIRKEAEACVGKRQEFRIQSNADRHRFLRGIMPNRGARYHYMRLDSGRTRIRPGDLMPMQHHSPGEAYDRPKKVLQRPPRPPVPASMRALLSQSDAVEVSLNGSSGSDPYNRRREADAPSRPDASCCESFTQRDVLQRPEGCRKPVHLPFYPAFGTPPDDIDSEMYLGQIVIFAREAIGGPWPVVPFRLFKETLLSEASKKVFTSVLWYLFCEYFQPGSDIQQRELLRETSRAYFRLSNELNVLVHDESETQDTLQSTRVKFRDRFEAVYPMLLANVIRHYFVFALAPAANVFNKPEFRLRLESDTEYLLSGVRKSDETISRLRDRAFCNRADVFDRRITESLAGAPRRRRKTQPRLSTVARTTRKPDISRPVDVDIHWGGLGRKRPSVLPIELSMKESLDQVELQDKSTPPKTFPKRVVFDCKGISPMMAAMAGRPSIFPASVMRHSDSLTKSQFGGSMSRTGSFLTPRLKSRLNSIQAQFQTLHRSISESRFETLQRERPHVQGEAPAPNVKDPRLYAAAVCSNLEHQVKPCGRKRLSVVDDATSGYPIVSNLSTGDIIDWKFGIVSRDAPVRPPQ